MRKLIIFSKRLTYIKNNIDSFVVQVIERNKKDIEFWQKEQMAHGENSQGSDIGYLQQVDYALQKISNGGRAAFGVVDLKNKGDFYDSIYAKVERTFIEIDAKDKKKPKLQKKYGQDIFGLNQFYLKKYTHQLTEKVIFSINNYLSNNVKP